MGKQHKLSEDFLRLGSRNLGDAKETDSFLRNLVERLSIIFNEIVQVVNRQMLKYFSQNAAPTTTDIPDGQYAVWKDADAVVGEPEYYIAYNDAGTIVLFPHSVGQINTDKSFAFRTPSGGSGIYYAGGYYNFYSGNNDFSGGPTFGTANSSYAAHFMVVLGADAVDELTLTITGTSITDAGVRTGSDTDSIVIAASAVIDAYFETSKKFLGQVTITVASGTAKTCNYGWCKYWDNRNSKFTVSAVELTLLAGANDTGFDFAILHHKATGWTYNVGSTPSPPTAITRMSTVHSTERELANNDLMAFKRTGLDIDIEADASEGVIFEITTTSNNAVDYANIILSILDGDY